MYGEVRLASEEGYSMCEEGSAEGGTTSDDTDSSGAWKGCEQQKDKQVLQEVRRCEVLPTYARNEARVAEKC